VMEFFGWRAFKNRREVGGLAGFTPTPYQSGESAREQVSLSRLNHWLPRSQAHPEVMQGTAEFHHQIADAVLPQADPVFDDATALDTTVDMLNAQSARVQGLVGQLLFQGELLAAGFLGRHEDLDLGERERQEAQIL